MDLLLLFEYLFMQRGVISKGVFCQIQRREVSNRSKADGKVQGSLTRSNPSKTRHVGRNTTKPDTHLQYLNSLREKDNLVQ